MDELDWRDISICQGMTTNWFFDDYEANAEFAVTMDDICLSCPVRNLCLADGVENKEYGLRGGVFLDNGKADKKRNAHKTQDVWDQIREAM